jgi:hypothetical protein
METEHFFVHYHAGEEEAAERIAMIAERAYGELSMGWAHRVFLKTHVIVTDSQDTANGRATAVPYPAVYAYVTAPEALSVLEAYDDWLDVLITHELVHVVHLDTVHGIARLVNAVLGFGVLGKVTSPNILQPRWVIEGIATMEESDRTSMGRRRSAQFDAFLRMAVLDDQFQKIDQVSSGARIWPHGTSVYLYGLHFMTYIESRYGHDKLKELSHIYATQIVPFGINRAVKKIVGVDFYQLWDEFEEHTKRRFHAQARRIRSRGLRQGRRLTFSGELTRYPTWSADDQDIYFYKADGHREEGLKRISARGGRMREGVGIGRQAVDLDVEHVIDIEDAAEASFVGATEDIVFAQNSVHDNRYRWDDLYKWNGGDPRGYEQLTFGMRASEPHVSPDGRTVVFRRNDVAQSRMGFLELATGDVVELPPFERISQVYTPRWAPDGDRVAFSAFRVGGYRDIYVYTRSTGAIERITADRHMDMSPAWTPDGKYVVFTSDRDDVYNIYAWDTEARELHQVSNVYGGAFEPMPSHDGKRIAYVGFSSMGYDLWVMELDPETFLPVMPTTSELPLAKDPRTPLPGKGTTPALHSERYKPIKTLYPRVLEVPVGGEVATNGIASLLSLSLGLRDVLGFHTLVGRVGYSSQLRTANFGVSYTLNRLYPEIRVAFSRDTYAVGGRFVRYAFDRDPELVPDSYQQVGYRERRTNVGVGMSIPVVQHARHQAGVNVAYSWTRWENLDEDDVRIDPNAPLSTLPEVGDAGEISGGISYSNTFDGSNRFTYGSELGRSADISLSVMDRRLAGDFDDLRARAGYAEYIPMPWRGHQTLVLSVRGGLSAGGLRRRGGFCVGDYAFSGDDAVLHLISRVPTGAGGCDLLRGYPGAGNPENVRTVAGQYFTVLSASYRIPLVDVDRGLGTVPAFLQRVALNPFVDWGNAWLGRVDVRDFLTGAGAALAINFRFGYVETIALILSYAHGFDRELGTNTFRAVVGGAF